MKFHAFRLGRRLFGLTFVLALGFGATQAIAAPAAAGKVAKACDFLTCDEQCISQGYQAGMCTYKDVCRCYP